MTLYKTTSRILKVSYGDIFASAVYLGDQLVWEPFVAYLTEITTPGAYTYDTSGIPDGARVDVILLGAGGGGQAGWTGAFPTYWGGNGHGGLKGSWNTVTLTKGVDFTGNITGTVGAGGEGGTGGQGWIGAGGGNTTAIAAGWAGLTAAGAAQAPGGDGVNQVWGESPDPATFNTRTYNGGTGGTPQAPGGYGAGGGGGSHSGPTWYGGGNGGPGKAFFYAYVA